MTAGRRGRSDAATGFGDEDRPVLLVEDEILIRIANADWLREAGYAVIEAADAAEALDILASDHPLALLATDITMPGAMDGLALAAHARAVRPGLPVLLLSAQLPDQPRAHAAAALAKPFGPSELLAVVETLIGEPWQTRTDESATGKAC